MITNPLDNMRTSIAYTRKRYGISEEAAEFRRWRGPDKIIEPTEQDWQLYREALAAAEVLDRISLGGSIYVGPIEIDEPEARREPGDYIETEDEWIHRVIELIASNGFPDDLDRALTVREFKTIYNALRAHEQNGNQR